MLQPEAVEQVETCGLEARPASLTSSSEPQSVAAATPARAARARTAILVFIVAGWDDFLTAASEGE